MTAPATVFRRERRATVGQPPSVLGYSLFWAVWAVGGIAVELVAVFNRTPGDTLSEHVWKWVTGNTVPEVIPTGAAWAGRVILLVFAGWIGPHLAFHWWTG